MTPPVTTATSSAAHSPPQTSSEPVSADLVYRRARAGLPCWVREWNGRRGPLPLARWAGGERADPADHRVDRAMLADCRGATLDLGCGPGRLTAALTERGVRALGVDTSAAAVAWTIERGGRALRRDIFGHLPEVGRWSRVLLADGNIGIGGDPIRLLRRAREMLEPEGRIIAEVDPPNVRGVIRQRIRWETDTAAGQWFTWARVGAAAVPEIAHGAGLRVLGIDDTAGRYLAHLAIR